MPTLNSFERRHIGVNPSEVQEMLSVINVSSIDELISQTVPDNIRDARSLNVDKGLSEHEYLLHIKQLAQKNKVFKSYIGRGYYGTITPSVILRNIFQNPGWYTQYTPYQAEIAQGRLEALLNFQTVVSDLTGMPIANASLLDEGTAAAEAMAMFEAIRNKKRKKNPAQKIFVDQNVFTQTLDILETRAKPINVEIVIGDWKEFVPNEDFIGVFIQYPDAIGEVHDYEDLVSNCKNHDLQVGVIADLLSLTLLKSPGDWGADAVVGTTQRFGVPMGFGGPHAAYFATIEKNKRIIPGRIIGVSVDRHNNRALRMALQTREQHIKRDKATSNICTAQALLAIMAGMYAVYHGPEGLKDIAIDIHSKTNALRNILIDAGFSVKNKYFFDTLSIDVTSEDKEKLVNQLHSAGINCYSSTPSQVSFAIDETTTLNDLEILANNIQIVLGGNAEVTIDKELNIPNSLKRSDDFLTHEVFHNYHTESKMMRYIKSLENKDLSLVHSMISLGSCTMKLNAATELIPVSWPEFASIHPFAPKDQVGGYYELFSELEKDLADITGFTACSLQPNSGAQGEYTGLLTIQAYHEANGDHQRNISLIPSSAHGTNPASAVMSGMKVVVVACDDKGNIDVEDLRNKAIEHKEYLSNLMITYPSTHGVFEKSIVEVCDIIHENGGLVYMDGANMNAQVGLTSPGFIGADVCHLNLHKTFAIPHGGGGPGMGPICVNDKLKPFLPGHKEVETGGGQGISAVSAAPWGSASILLISYAYIKMLGTDGLTEATKMAILNANYMKSRLEQHYPILYTGEQNRAAHEFILDLRPYKPVGISAEDVAKRLMDYGFHAPTLSFPVAGTVMIEPTESEDKDELDRFCDAMISIKKEIDEVANGDYPIEDNVLSNAPHTLNELTNDQWSYSYTRKKAAFALEFVRQKKFWPSIARVDNAHGDRNLICTCAPIEMYQD